MKRNAFDLLREGARRAAEVHVLTLRGSEVVLTVERGKGDIRVVTPGREVWIKLEGDLSPIQDPEPVVDIHVLKSMLQKAVRFGDSRALELAAMVARVSWRDFCRRFPIICIEDSALHPLLPLAVYCMLAESKGLVPTLELRLQLIGAYRDLALHPTRHVYPEGSISWDDANLVGKLLLVRAAFGGKAFDVDLLSRAAAYWSGRQPVVTALSPPSPEILSRWHPEALIPEGVDAHTGHLQVGPRQRDLLWRLWSARSLKPLYALDEETTPPSETLVGSETEEMDRLMVLVRETSRRVVARMMATLERANEPRPQHP